MTDPWPFCCPISVGNSSSNNNPVQTGPTPLRLYPTTAAAADGARSSVRGIAVRPSNFTRLTTERRTVHGSGQGRHAPSAATSGGDTVVPLRTQEDSMVGHGGHRDGRLSFFNKLTSKFSKRCVRSRLTSAWCGVFFGSCCKFTVSGSCYGYICKTLGVWIFQYCDCQL